MRVKIYYSPVGVPGKKDTTQLSLSLTLLKCLMAPTFNGAFEEYYQFICELKKKSSRWIKSEPLGPERIKEMVLACSKKEVLD